MTAIIGFISQNQISIAVDSIITKSDSVSITYENNFQKLYPLNENKIAVIQFNNVWFKGIEIRNMMSLYAKKCENKLFSTVKECYLDFIEFLENSESINISEGVNGLAMGLIFFGIGENQIYPCLYEIYLESYINKKINYTIKYSYDLENISTPFFYYNGDGIEYADEYVMSNTLKLDNTENIIQTCEDLIKVIINKQIENNKARTVGEPIFKITFNKKS